MDIVKFPLFWDHHKCKTWDIIFSGKSYVFWIMGTGTTAVFFLGTWGG